MPRRGGRGRPGRSGSGFRSRRRSARPAPAPAPRRRPQNNNTNNGSKSNQQQQQQRPQVKKQKPVLFLCFGLKRNDRLNSVGCCGKKQSKWTLFFKMSGKKKVQMDLCFF